MWTNRAKFVNKGTVASWGMPVGLKLTGLAAPTRINVGVTSARISLGGTRRTQSKAGEQTQTDGAARDRGGSDRCISV